MKRLTQRCLTLARPLFVGGLLTTALVSHAALAADPPQCQTVRMGVVNWTDVIATSGMAQVLLDDLGYDTKQTSAAQQIIFAGIRDNRLDVFLGYWKPAMDKNIEPFIAARQVSVMSPPSLNDAQATLAVPQYVADAGLKTFADIAKFKDKLGGKIYGIESGSGANATIQKMIDTNQFGLGGFKLVESGEAGMLAAVQRATTRKEFVVFVGWKPHPMNINMKMAYLTGSEDVYGPNEGAATVSFVTAPDYAQRCPNVDQLLKNLTFTSAQESALMVPIMERKTPEEVARKWLKEHPQDLQRWLAGVTTFDGKDGIKAVQVASNP
ncbi:choline ABC transporter substrate-binding protein [Pseudomonas sp. dw_358]|uniref:choline ABC transporter substrate-binding protein n=1 Tax=Pseudomonas sp. dw_358 TaxID=2720083 RepID=UPI001BD5D966|nr:choline ABC transporter substrate-binding protein [Pseudomonas sp. dw_358]